MALKETDRGITRSFRVGIFFNVVLICLLGVGVMVGLVLLARSFSYKMDLRFDVTRDARYTLDPLSKTLLRDLETPVQVLFVYGWDQNIARRCLETGGGQPRRDILLNYYRPLLSTVAARIGRVTSEWSNVSPHIGFGVVASFLDPAQAQKVAASLNTSVSGIMNQVIVSVGNRRRAVPIDRLADIEWGYFDPQRRRPPRPPHIRGRWRVQAELTNALREVLTGEKTTIGVPAGVNSKLEPGSGPYKVINQLLSGQGYSLLPLKLIGMRRVPDEVDLLLLPAVGVKVGSRESELIKEFERRGGRLLVVTDPDAPEVYKELLEPYGIRVKDEIVIDARNSLARLGLPEELRSTDLCDPASTIASPLAGKIPIHVGATRAIGLSPDRAPGTAVSITLRGSSDARAIPVEYQESARGMVRLGGREHASRNPVLAVEARRKPEVAGAESRVVLFCSDSLIDPAAVSRLEYGNRDLLLNALAWLADRPAAIAIQPRDDLRTRIDPVSKSFDPVFWVAVIALPGLGLLLSIVCFVLRRA